MEYRGESTFSSYYGYPVNREGYLRMMQDNNWNQAIPVPFYRTYPMTRSEEEEERADRDLENMKSMYPEMAKHILSVVEEECDKLEYDGSIMFDEFPDRVSLKRMCLGIYERVKKEMGTEGMEPAQTKPATPGVGGMKGGMFPGGMIETMPEGTEEGGAPTGGGMTQGGVSAMQYGSRCPYNNWMCEMVEVLLFQEMFRRRCRRNRCRRRLYW